MSISPTPLPSALSINAVRAQFASRPTLESVNRQLLAAALTQKYPTLKIDLARTRLAVPTADGVWNLHPFVARVMDYLANGNPLGRTKTDRHLRRGCRPRSPTQAGAALPNHPVQPLR